LLPIQRISSPSFHTQGAILLKTNNYHFSYISLKSFLQNETPEDNHEMNSSENDKEKRESRRNPDKNGKKGVKLTKEKV
jgi:hypothetical protein